MANRRVNRLALLDRQLQASKPLPAFDAEQVRARRLALQPAHQHGVDLVLAPRAGVDELLAPREPTAQHPAALIWHPHRVKLPLPQQPRQRARVKPIGLRARLRDPGVIRADHDHALHMRLEDPRDLPRAASHLQRHPIRRLKALRQLRSASGVLGTRPAERTSPSSQIATTQKSRCTSRPIARPTHLNNNDTSHLQFVDNERENQRDNDTDRYELEAQSRQVAGAANEKHGLEAHRQLRPTRLRSPKKAPVPDHPTLRPEPDGPSEQHFHAARTRA